MKTREKKLDGFWLVAGLAVMVIGVWIAGCQQETKGGAKDAAPVKADPLYTCPMHPEVIKHEPGKCPICGMDLVPVEPGKKAGAPGGLEPKAPAAAEGKGSKTGG